ncbi:MAG: hypothetical protein A2Y17_12040 [Clostridiales bacterium GWF2_38_85]|nr:MAG: hypothetical protein A2Y17_12040 [Clostridiales bacterium GWF2_38_85]
MEDNLEIIKKAIKDPDCIYASVVPDRDVYFHKSIDATYGNDYYTKVIVEISNPHIAVGDIKTAFLSKNITGGIDKEQLKYEKRIAN